MKLSKLQKMSDRQGRVNTVYARAANGDAVTTVSGEIEGTVDGASVTTASDLAEDVSGSLVDAKNLASKLGSALGLVGLVGAVLIAILLTLASVAKRTRELGTLKAVGWSQRLVVRQVAGESLVQGLLGGVVGAVLGVAAAYAIASLAPSLTASVAAAESGPAVVGAAVGPGGPPGGGGGFGQGAVEPLTSSVDLTAPISPSLILLAIALAVAGGLLAGAVAASARHASVPPTPFEPSDKEKTMTTLTELRGVSRIYGSNGTQIHAVRDVDLTDRARRAAGDRGPERLRQDHAAPAARRDGPPDRRRGPPRGPRPRPPGGRTAGQDPSPDGRLRASSSST